MHYPGLPLVDTQSWGGIGGNGFLATKADPYTGSHLTLTTTKHAQSQGFASPMLQMAVVPTKNTSVLPERVSLPHARQV